MALRVIQRSQRRSPCSGPRTLRYPLFLATLSAVLPVGGLSGQEPDNPLEGLMRYFEVQPAAMEAAQQDSIRILAEINRNGRRTTPVSYPTSQQQQCRAAALLVFALAIRVVSERGWTEDVEVDVTCSGYRSTILLSYPDSVTLTDRQLPSGAVLFTKTRTRPDGLDPGGD